MDKARWNASGSIVGRFIKSISSTMFGQPIYSMDRQGPLIVISGTHKDFINSAVGVWIGGKYFSGGC